MSPTSGSAAGRRLLAAVGLGVAAVLCLSGCGANLEPGVAAKVAPPSTSTFTGQQTTFSQNHIDDVTIAACHYIAEANKTSQQPRQFPTATIRSNVLSQLISFELLGSLSDSKGLTIRPADVARVAAGTTVPTDLSEKDQQLLTAFFADEATAELDQATIAANVSDPGKTTSEGVTPGETSASDPIVADWFKKADVDVNPGYGTWTGQQINPGSGSLSVIVSNDAKTVADALAKSDVSNLPRSQICG